MESITDTSELSIATGCFLGALVGDALGAFLEFKRAITEVDVKEAFKMKGGGVHKLGPGQITDDSEMAMSLAHGLVQGKRTLDLNAIASRYGLWFESMPFDIGGTTRNAVPKAVKMKEHQAEMMRKGAAKSIDSQSNGSLMRMTPICIWSRCLSPEDLEKAVIEEISLTHPNPGVQAICVCYALGIHYLFQNPADYKGAYETMKEYIKVKGEQAWLSIIEAQENDQLTDVKKASGWAIHALILGCIVFEEVLRIPKQWKKC